MQRRQTRFLPKALAVELRRLPWRLLGLLLLAVAASCWLALVSWSYIDPGPNYATQARPQNWLGYWGSGVADALIQAFGLSSALIILPVAALGLQIAQGDLPLRPRLRLAYWVASFLALPAFFASFPTPSRWLLSYGLGGMVGDFVVYRFAKLSSAMPSFLLWPIIALVFGGIGGWCIGKACGLSWGEIVLLLQGGATQKSNAFGFQKTAAKSKASESFVSKLTSWTKSLLGGNRASAAAPKPAGPREFWMNAAHAEPSLKPAKANKQRAPEPATATGARSHNEASPSPFTNWDGATGGFVKPKANGHRHSGAKDDALVGKRIEPFFEPSSEPSFETAEDEVNGSESTAPLKRFTARATQAAQTGAQRIFDSVAERAQKGSGIIFTPKPTPQRDENPRVTAPDVSEAEQEDEEEADFSVALPPVSLLAAPPRESAQPAADDPALMQRAALLMSVLGDFGVKGRISGIYPGPVITLFELEPARGTKSSRVVGLADDIARSMSAVSARVAVVPGRDAIGIELPNAKREIVSLRGMFESSAFQMSQASLPLALGKSIGGEPIVADLARMPHLLIAGTTGSGKSVGINTMILSLLYRLPPSQCNFIMIDPKMLELSVYDGIPHLLAPVVTDPKKAIAALKWTVKEMNARYERMCKLGVRNITSYNAKAAAAQLRGQPLRRVVQTGFDPRTDEMMEEEETFEPVSMPYLVVVIDEMADLMMVAGKDIEFAVQRLSQMARAAGIHLIMATQRPSVDVVTGTIKANFPSRISFQVTSKIDSRTIIGEQGAEQLLGAGDMLYMAAGGRIIRAHGPFVSDEEVEGVTRYLKSQGVPSYREDILEDADDLGRL